MVRTTLSGRYTLNGRLIPTAVGAVLARPIRPRTATFLDLVAALTLVTPYRGRHAAPDTFAGGVADYVSATLPQRPGRHVAVAQ